MGGTFLAVYLSLGCALWLAFDLVTDALGTAHAAVAQKQPPLPAWAHGVTAAVAVSLVVATWPVFFGVAVVHGLALALRGGR
jgi:hypothetical protein